MSAIREVNAYLARCQIPPLALMIRAHAEAAEAAPRLRAERAEADRARFEALGISDVWSGPIKNFHDLTDPDEIDEYRERFDPHRGG